ncbi:uncharacterized protein LOC117597593 [Pangasianodon hypophthalmus]|uniref:uncharacterized protein LOC117597593 n=1 Tax=Pangasianodon hypophthalmus TaxID=310915 RepID=UPI00147A4399|nr:uncharacterized protein LOC117597593 [Pangasianodon hypophthalmus]
MFVTVILGEKRAELLNLNCRIVNFIHCLKEKCKLDPQVQVDLLDRTGEIVHLMEMEHSVDLVSTLLKGRQSYIVLSVSRSEGSEELQYSAVHDGDLRKSHPEVEVMLRKLSNLSKKRDKRSALKKGSVSHVKTKVTSTSTKSTTSAPGS